MKPLWKVINICAHSRTLTLTFTLTLTLTLTFTLTLIHIHIHVHVHVHTHLHMQKHTHTHIHVHVRVRVRVGGRGEGGKGSGGGWVGGSVGRWVGEYVLVRMCVLCVLIPSAVSPQDKKWSSTASSGKVNDWRTRERVVLDLFSNLEWVRTKGFLSVNLSKARDNSTWAVSWLAELTVTPLPSPSFPPLLRVFRPKKPPCVGFKNVPRVYRHHARMW